MDRRSFLKKAPLLGLGLAFLGSAATTTDVEAARVEGNFKTVPESAAKVMSRAFPVIHAGDEIDSLDVVQKFAQERNVRLQVFRGGPENGWKVFLLGKEVAIDNKETNDGHLTENGGTIFSQRDLVVGEVPDTIIHWSQNMYPTKTITASNNL